MSPYFPRRAEISTTYWCPNCEAHYRTIGNGGMACLVMHGPGDCCHFGEERVTEPPPSDTNSEPFESCDPREKV